MLRSKSLITLGLAALIVAVVAAPAAANKKKSKAKDRAAQEKLVLTECELDFSLKGWSAFYKTGRGQGTVRCDNGQSARVALRTRGGGLTFGKFSIDDGSGSFSPVEDISQVFGAYGTASAHAGAARSAAATAMTKGSVSLALAGTGRGFDLGIDFGRFTVRRLAGQSESASATE